MKGNICERYSDCCWWLDIQCLELVRTSRSLHKLLLMLPSSCYFDDFPMFSTTDCATATDAIISEFLDLLGWNHAKTGSKAHPFSDVFSVLGMQIDLSKLQEGCVVLSNKPGRVERIVERLSALSQDGRLTVHEAQVLLGLLNFSSGFETILPVAVWFFFREIDLRRKL